MTYGSLFSGIGGLDLGLDRAGFTCKWQVENDPYAIKVLAKRWPDVKRYGDITCVNGHELEPVDLICGGFPCQDLSQAGKRVGIEGTRSGLWFEYARIVGLVRPRYVLIENVPGLLVPGAMRRVVGELARLGYVGCYRSLRASEFGASHLRKRVFIVAHRECQRSERRGDGRVLEAAPAEEHREALQRQRDGHAAHDSGIDLANRAETRCSGREDAGTDRRHAGENGRGRIEPERIRGELGNTQRARWAQAGIGRDLDAGSEPEAGRRALADTQPASRGGHEEIGGEGGRVAPAGTGRGLHGSLAHTLHEGLSRGWAETGCGPTADCAVRSGEHLAHAHALQREQPERQRAGSGDTGIAGTRNQPSGPDLGMEFAPGPSDPRWPAILRACPDLAPALESPLRGVAPRLPDWMDGAMSNRTKRLGRLGNAVVPQIAEWVGLRIREFEQHQQEK